MSPRRFAVWLLVGLVAQVGLLSLRGTSDVLVLKTWAVQSVESGVLAAYRRPVPRGEWERPDYPPLAISALTAAAWITQWIDPDMNSRSRVLTVLVKTLGLLARMALVALIYWLLARDKQNVASAQTAALVVWLNPAFVLNGPALGYLDPLCWSVGLISLVLAGRGHWRSAGTIAMVAALVKPQGLFFVAAVVMASTGKVQRLIRSAGCAVVTLVAVIVPFAVGSGTNEVIRGLGRNFREDMLSGHALNLWWIVTALTRVMHEGVAVIDQPLRLIALSRFAAGSDGQLRLIVSVFVIASALAVAWSVRRCPDVALISAATALMLHIYCVLAVSVHENHFIYAVAALCLAATYLPTYRSLLLAASTLALLNMLLFYGVGRDFARPDRSGWFWPITVALSCAAIGLLLVHLKRFIEVRRSSLSLASVKI